MAAPATAEAIRDVNTRYHDDAAASYDAKWGIDFGPGGLEQVMGKLGKILPRDAWPFGGGVRRCIGASFALFEMEAVLGAVLRAVDLRAVDPEPERTARRAITLVPGRGARALASPAA